jgi:hypothetical protein
MSVIDRELIEAIGALLREHTRAQNKVLLEVLRELKTAQFEALRELKTAQFEALEEALGAHLKAEGDLVDRLLARLEALFRAPSGEPESGQQRLDS